VEIPSSQPLSSCTYRNKQYSHCIAFLFCVFFCVSVCGFVYMEKSMTYLVSAIVILCCFCCVNYVTSDASDHRYKEGDFVPFYVNKVGPFHNPRLDF